MTVRMSDLLDTAGRDARDLPAVPQSRHHTGRSPSAASTLSTTRPAAPPTLGFTDVVVHWPRAEDIYVGDDRILDEVAGRLRGGEIRS